MTQTSMNTPYAKRVAEKFREAQNYLKTNGFSRSTKPVSYTHLRAHET